MKKWLTLSVIILLAASTIAVFVSNYLAEKSGEIAQFYVGVSFCGNTTAEAKLLIDRVKNYTNLFVLQSGPISENETSVNEICDYAVKAGLSIVVYFGDLDSRVLSQEKLWRLHWLNTTKERYGDRFLGVQYYDEPGGIYIDTNWNESMIRPRNYTYANLTYDVVADVFNRRFHRDLGFDALNKNRLPVFVSDYALYWFDFLAGYDVVLAQAGWNHSLVQDIALVRGAATMQNKSWGVIITWKYDNPPYLDDGDAIYEQMRTAYESGAEYIVIFNYPTLEGNNYGVMLDRHFEALERFWNEVVKNPEEVHGGIKAEAALVLPRNYGWGMRHLDDRIWGWWGPDEKSPQIWAIVRQLLSHYDSRLDIVYEDFAFPIEGAYPQIYYWNQTTNFG